MNIKLQRMCKDAIVAYCDVMFQYFSVDTEENHKNVLG